MSLLGRGSSKESEPAAGAADGGQKAGSVLTAEPPKAEDSAEADAGPQDALAGLGEDVEDEPSTGGTVLSPDGEDDTSDSMMDIFTSEEEEDVDLSNMTRNLVEISMEELLTEAMEVAEQLREKFDNA